MIVQKTFYSKDILVDEMNYKSNSREAIKYLKNMGLGETTRYKIPGSNLSVQLKNVITLKGKIEPRFSNLADGSIITLFDKTPFPENQTDVVCPHFVELKWANGCKFDCAWCYLNGTLRFRPCGKRPYLKDENKILSHISNFLNQYDKPCVLNSGELSDSLVFESNGQALSKKIIPLFKEQKDHKLLILTKSSDIKKLLKTEAQKKIIVSFSLNAFDVAKRWEKGAPKPKSRIKAAKKLSDAGYKIRIRIDPIVPIENWESGYIELITHLFENITPERITLGSLRGLQSTINNSLDKSWVDYLDDRSNWGKKISFDKRFLIYRSIISYLEDKYNYSNVGLCKETVEMWNKLGMDYREIMCNCIH
jgi:spore photoproduct lyase